MPQSERRSFTFENVHLAPDEQIGLHQQSTWELSYVIVGSGMRLMPPRKSTRPSIERP